jgi:hypothetical protein
MDEQGVGDDKILEKEVETLAFKPMPLRMNRAVFESGSN